MKGNSSFTLDVESGLDLGLAGDGGEGLVVHNLLEVLAGLLLGILPLVVAVHLATYFLIYATRNAAPYYLWRNPKALLQRMQSLLLLWVVVKSFPVELLSARLEHNHSWHSELGKVERGGLCCFVEIIFLQCGFKN